MTKSTNQALYCADMAQRLAERVKAREKLRSNFGTYPMYGSFGMGQMETSENIRRMIRQLRAELLELEGMVQSGN